MVFKKWVSIEPDKWGNRFERQRPSCGNRAFRVVKEKERAKKHRGPRADRVAIICANPECQEHKLGKTRRAGYPVRRRLKAA